MIQRERLVKDFEAMAQLTAPGEGINRLAFTDACFEERIVSVWLFQSRID